MPKNSSKIEIIDDPNNNDDTNDTDGMIGGINRECIVCDSCCLKSNPKYRCSNCRLTYYCDEVCSNKHWQVHKSHCKSLDEIRKQFLIGIISSTNNHNNKNNIKTTTTTTTKKCEICERTNDDQQGRQLQLLSSLSLFDDDCSSCCCTSSDIDDDNSHTFCFQCLLQYQKYAPPKTTKKVPCPICFITTTASEVTTTTNEVIEVEEGGKGQPSKKKNHHNMMMTRAAIQMAKAAAQQFPTNDDDERKQQQRNKYCQLALDDIECIQDEDPNNITVKLMYADVLDLLGQHDMALELLQDNLIKLKSGKIQESAQQQIQQCMDEVKDCIVKGDQNGAEVILDKVEQIRNQKYSISITPTDVVDLILRIAQIQQNMDDYEGAKHTYQSIIQDYSTTTPTTNDDNDNNNDKNDDHTKTNNHHVLSSDQYLQIYMGCCHCLYELQQYDIAIDMGNTAIGMNRHYPQVYKYVVKSYIAKGGSNDDDNIELAQHLANRAVLYETPWDDTNQTEAKTTYNELLLKMMKG